MLPAVGMTRQQFAVHAQNERMISAVALSSVDGSAFDEGSGWFLAVCEVVRVPFQLPVPLIVGAVVVLIKVIHMSLLCLLLNVLQPFNSFAPILVLRRSVGCVWR